jgi:hypothetical protein
MGLKLTGAYQQLVCADDVDIVEVNIDTTKKNTETLIDSSKEGGLEINAEKTKYMLLSRHQNAGHNHGIKIGHRYSENVARLRYFGNNYNKSKFDSGGN